MQLKSHYFLLIGRVVNQRTNLLAPWDKVSRLRSE